MPHKQSILVHVIHHPVESRNVTVTEVPYRRQTLSMLKEQFVPGQDVLAGLNNKQVEIDSHCVKPGSKVVFLPAAADVGTFTFLQLTGWWAVGAYVAVSVGLSYLGGQLFGPDMPEHKEAEGGQAFSWDPQTTHREGGVRPVCYGRNMHYGNVVARWTDVGNLTRVGFTGHNKANDTQGKYEAIVEFAESEAVIESVGYDREWLNSGGKDAYGYEKVYLYYGDAWNLISTKDYNYKGGSTDTITITAGGPWNDVTKVKLEAFIHNDTTYPLPRRPKIYLNHYLYQLRAMTSAQTNACIGGTPTFNALPGEQNVSWETTAANINDGSYGLDNDEVLFMLLDYGGGPVKGKTGEVFFNDQPASHHSSVNIQERLGHLNQTCMQGFEQNKLEYRPAAEMVYDEDPVLWSTKNNFVDDIEYTLGFPRGIFSYQSSGNIANFDIGVKVEISEYGEDDWTTLLDTTISGSQQHPLYKAYKVNTQVPGKVVRGKYYTLRLQKTTPTPGSGSYGGEMWLRSTREVVDTAFTHPGRALLGIRALATSRLSGHINVKFVADDKLVQVYDGSTWEVEHTHNRAFITLDELTQPVISGDGSEEHPWVIEGYEGLDPSRIDLAFFYEWAQWCAAQVTSGLPEPDHEEDRMPCDMRIDYETDVWSLAYEISQVGRTYLYWQGNTLTGWIDKEVTDDPIDLITMDNTMLRSWKSNWSGHGEMAGKVNVFYRDKLLGYERKERPVHNENAGLYTRIVSVEGIGVTGCALATRVGNHALKRSELIKNRNSVRMFKDALRYRLGRVVRMQNKVPDWGVGYRVIKSEANNTVELDRTCTADADDIIFVRSYDEANEKVVVDSYTVASVAGKVVTITTTWDVTPVKNNIFAVGVDGKIKERRIIKIRHTMDNYFDVELETYDANLFASDDANPNLPAPGYIWSQPPAALVKPITREEVVDIISRMLPPAINTDIPWTGNCSWLGNDVDTVNWEKCDEDEPIVVRYRGATYEITPDSTTLEYIYWDPSNPNVFLKTDDRAKMLASILAGGWSMCDNQDGVPLSATPMQILHVGLIQAAQILADQIIIGGINALGLLNAPAEAGADVTGTHEAATIASQGALAVLNVVGGAQIDNLVVDTLHIKNEAVTILTATQDDDWYYLDPSPLSQAGYGLYRAAVWTSSFTSTGFPCHVVFDTSVDGVDVTFVSKAMHVIFRTEDTYPELLISTITLVGANLVKITTTAAHGLDTDDFVWFWDIVGTIELNNAICKITVVNTTEFTLQLTRSDWFTAYTSGGKAIHVNSWGIRYGFTYPAHDIPAHVSVFDPFLDAGKSYQYIGAIRNRNSSQYAYVNEGSTIIASEVKK